ncbi:hypothetical protein [Stenotrophomonas pavanii]|uniref:hypothetical protein n=1 Tax=Stenotrophomonas pavanii TaxID=487698 RepID=UPI003CCEC634
MTGLQSALDGKAAASHSHTIANVTGLQSALDGKSALGHTHNSTDIANHAPCRHTQGGQSNPYAPV